MREVKEIDLETSRGMAHFEIQQMGGKQAGLMLIGLAKKLGPAIGMLVSPKQEVGAIIAVLEKIEPSDFDDLCKKVLIGRCSVDGEFADLNSGAVDELFAGHVENLFRLVWHALQANYGNFFAALTKLAPKGKPLSAIPNPSKV